MKKTIVLAALALTLGAGAAHAVDIGIGGFGGVSVPVLNDLSEQGTTFGVRVPVRLIPLVTVEPFFASSALGEVEESFGTATTYTRDGGETSGFGVNALLTFGTGRLMLYPMAGIGQFTFEREGAEDIEEMGYNLGLGLAISPMDKLALHVRGELNMIVTDETAVKAANVTVGLSYTLFSTPGGGQ